MYSDSAADDCIHHFHVEGHHAVFPQRAVMACRPAITYRNLQHEKTGRQRPMRDERTPAEHKPASGLGTKSKSAALWSSPAAYLCPVELLHQIIGARGLDRPIRVRLSVTVLAFKPHGYCRDFSTRARGVPILFGRSSLPDEAL